MNLSIFIHKATETHNIIYKSQCTCTLTSPNLHDLKVTSSLTLTNKGIITKIKANIYLLGCPICHKTVIQERESMNTQEKNTRVKATKSFISLAHKIHEGKGYLYKYDSNTFLCPRHGYQDLNNLKDHLLAITPCTSCDKERLRDRYISQCNSHGGNTNLYLLKFSIKDTHTPLLEKQQEQGQDIETFYKVGLCITSIKDRFKLWTKYDITPIQIINNDATKLYDLEQYIHSLLDQQNSHYIPQHHQDLGGISECFILPEDRLSKLSQYITQAVQ